METTAAILFGASPATAAVTLASVVFVLWLFGCISFTKKRSDVPPPASSQGKRKEYSENEFDLICCGAGLAGASIGYSAAIQGKRVLLLDRGLGVRYDRIVGELLQPGGYESLRKLDLADCALGINECKVYGYAMFLGSEANMKIPYPKRPDGSGEKYEGRSFRYEDLVEKLREKVAKQPTAFLRKAVVQSLVEENGKVVGVEFRNEDGDVEVARAPLTFASDGIYSSIRRSLTTKKPRSASYFVGLLLKDCELPYPNYGHVILMEPSPVLFYPCQNNPRHIRCLVSVPGSLPSIAKGEMHAYLKERIMPQIPADLRTPFEEAIDRGDIKSMPCQNLGVEPEAKAGAMLVGDALNMRHPLTGGGMTVCLSDIVIIRDLLKEVDNLDNPETLLWLRDEFFERRKPLAATVNILADALFGVFCSTESEDMRKACYEYLSKGGVFQAGPIGFLSGTKAKPHFLIFHFFAVAVYGVVRILFPFPTPGKIVKCYHLLSAACRIIRPLVHQERGIPIVTLVSKLLGSPDCGTCCC